MAEPEAEEDVWWWWVLLIVSIAIGVASWVYVRYCRRRKPKDTSNGVWIEMGSQNDEDVALIARR